eukprot:gb/GFBE01022681.1/.p1 GENE.gb/GFBE01022681.1/~~gb/GFBE01022681.1/.p1  ORF type:complete len:108 (+),score=16.65 gb/GFBE01022681.1/:1-324(+)
MAARFLLGTSVCLGLSQAVLFRSDTSTDPPCHKFQCPENFVPKVGHHELNGNSASECCDETCGYYMIHVGCGNGYIANEEYASNVGKTDAMCCDKVCTKDQDWDHFV